MAFLLDWIGIGSGCWEGLAEALDPEWVKLPEVYVWGMGVSIENGLGERLGGASLELVQSGKSPISFPENEKDFLIFFPFS